MSVPNIKRQVCVLVALFMLGLPAYAGNDDKRGQAGATELLIFPFSRSIGMANANAAGCVA